MKAEAVQAWTEFVVAEKRLDQAREAADRLVLLAEAELHVKRLVLESVMHTMAEGERNDASNEAPPGRMN